MTPIFMIFTVNCALMTKWNSAKFSVRNWLFGGVLAQNRIIDEICCRGAISYMTPIFMIFIIFVVDQFLWFLVHHVLFHHFKIVRINSDFGEFPIIAGMSSESLYCSLNCDPILRGWKNIENIWDRLPIEGRCVIYTLVLQTDNRKIMDV